MLGDATHQGDVLAVRLPSGVVVTSQGEGVGYSEREEGGKETDRHTDRQTDRQTETEQRKQQLRGDQHKTEQQ